MYLRFPGQYFDTEDGLHYNDFRDYDPSLGRYIESDPMGKAGDLVGDLYRYALDNPIAYGDPSGLWTYTMTAAVGFGVSITVGHNGGKWSVGAYGGVGDGLSAVYSAADTGCTPSGFKTGAEASGTMFGNGVSGAEYVLNATGTGGYAISTTFASSGIGMTARVGYGNQGMSIRFSPTIGVGESYFAGVGGTLRF